MVVSVLKLLNMESH